MNALIIYSSSSSWASEASPTLACSIEISRDIYMCMSTIVYGKHMQKNLYAKMRWRNYVVQTRACSKSVLGVETKCRL